MKAGFRPALGWFGQTSLFEAHVCVCVCVRVHEWQIRLRTVDQEHCPEGVGYTAEQSPKSTQLVPCLLSLGLLTHTGTHLMA